MNPERFNPIENRSEVDPQRIVDMKKELLDALVFIACPDMDGSQECVMNWFNENGELFDTGFDRLLELRPKALEEWESADAEKRAEIMDIINGPIVGRHAGMDVAA